MADEQQQAQEEQQPQAEAQDEQQQSQEAPAATLTQEQFDAALTKRLNAERKKWQAESDENARKAAMTETERLKAEKEAAEKAAADAVSGANALLIKAEAKVQAMALGVAPERLDAVLKLAELSEVEVADGVVASDAVKAAIADVLKTVPELKGSASAASRSGGDFQGGSQQQAVYSLAEVTKMAARDPRKFAEIREDYMAATREPGTPRIRP